MPFYQRSWNSVLGELAPKVSNRRLRTVPVGDQPLEGEPPQLQEVPKARVSYTRQMLKDHVDDLLATKCCYPIKGNEKFLSYQIQRDEPMFHGKFSAIYACTNKQMGDVAMIARIYNSDANINVEKELFLKMLRYIGRDHPCIIGTMDIFADDDRNVYIIQEFANNGNAYDYVQMNENVVSEKQLCRWAQSIYKAMSYLGDVSISHRSIQPKHMLLKVVDNSEIITKLTGFRDAVIYWDPDAYDLVDCACLPISKRSHVGFEAPEVFGEYNEYFNPHEADVWSFGATIFFIGSKTFPFNMQNPEPNMDSVIRENVERSSLSQPAKNWLYGLMRADTKFRIPFESIASDTWFKSF
ncbi:hypothetical protein RDWZM_004487 [Blomia tropicalis]|uniref:Protein kinase domain-containing protein n=1 Tax=Blomia tropicalis TaxID=40697 RepID=A0A9Q0M7A9_BLOTA|nr:hypothetical protein RDWZM_004487 [Blomia tropicalis]